VPRPRSSKRQAALDAASRILDLQRAEESDRDFAARVGLSPQTIANYRAGATGASVDALAQVVIRTGASARWLILGDLPPMGPEQPSEEFGRGAESVLVEARRWLNQIEERFTTHLTYPSDQAPRRADRRTEGPE
jgi:transcriptional regulator with XRE-family HTH domain